MFEELGPEQLAVIDYHTSQDFQIPESNQRSSYYGVNGVPDTYFDGTDNSVGGSGGTYNAYLNIINNHLDDDRPMTLDVFGFIDENVVSAGAYINLEQDIAASNVYVRAVVTESGLIGPMDGDTYHFIARDYYQEELTISQTGESAEVTIEFPVDPEWVIEELNLVVFVQNDGNKEVYQAANISDAGCFFEGNVTDSETGDPIPAHIWSAGMGFQTNADEYGDYSLATSPGDHVVKAEYFGYYEHTSAAMSIELQEVIQYDFTLDPLPTVTLQGTIVDFDDNPIEGAIVTLLDVPVDPVQSNDAGVYVFEIPGDMHYGMQVEADGYDMVLSDVDVPASGYVQDFVMFQCIQFEADNAGFTTQGDWGPGFGNDWEWGAPVEAGGPLGTYDGSNAWGTNLDAAYASNAGRSLITGEYELEGMDDGTAYLKFYHWMEARKQSQTYWDGGNVQISVDGGAWEIIDPIGGYTSASIIGLSGARGFGGETDTWVPRVFDITEYVGSNVKFRFQFGSTNNNGKRGWFIDHFTIYGANVWGESSGIADNDTKTLPHHFSLSQNFPNPFNPTTTILYSIPNAGDVSLKVYDVNGKLIKTILSETKEAGYYSATWNGVDDAGATVGSGVYFYRIDAGDYTQTKRCLLLK